ncbi:hypothetical protein D3C81_827140 [compost metagenome]
MQQVQHAVVAEIRAVLAGLRIQCVQLGIGTGQEHARGAGAGRGCRGRRHRIDEVRQAAAGLVLPLWLHAGSRVEAPALLAGVRIQGDGQAVRRAQVQRVADLERSDFIRGFTHVRGLAHVAGTHLPGQLQLADVGRGDLLQRREALAMIAAAVGMPFARGRCVVAQRGIGVDDVHRQLAVDFVQMPWDAGKGHRGHQQGTQQHRPAGRAGIAMRVGAARRR